MEKGEADMGILSEEIKKRVLLYDGSKGVMLQMGGLSGGESAEEWNLSHPEKVREVYNGYIDAGSDIIQTNTFCANRPSLQNHGLAEKLYEINFEGARLALECAEGKNVMVAASVGPTGLFFQPAGDMTFESAVGIFKEQLVPIKDAGVKIINFETFTDLNEMRAAMVAATELGELEIISSMTFDGGRTMSGNTPQVCAVTCGAMGAALAGANCSGGPDSLLEPINQMEQVSITPLCVKPNAGLPEMESGVAVFRQTPEDFAKLTPEFIKAGVRLIGGCCGSGPDHIRAMRRAVDAAQCAAMPAAKKKMLASPYEVVEYTPDTQLAEMNLDVDSVRNGVAGGDFFCLMDVIPAGVDDADAVILNFGGLKPDFDMWSLASTLGMFVKKPVIIKAGREIAQAFLRCYAGRAGILCTEECRGLYGALELQ